MLITKFNRMIRNKFIWGALAFIVSISFVLSYSAVTSSCSRTSTDAIAMMFGEEVSFLEFRKARIFEQGFERQRETSEEQETERDKQAWKRIAVLHLADQMGIKTSMHEVGRVIRQSPGFSVNGEFDKNQYARLVANRIGIDTGTFEIYQQENMTIEKLYNVMRSMIWTAPYEINSKVRDLTDSFKVEYALFETDKFTPEVQLTDQDVRNFYDENVELFREPKRVSVKYVSFPFEKYASTNEVDAQRVAIYYENNQEDFVDQDSTNSFVEYLLLDDVREDIVAILRQDDAIEAARNDAMDFAIALIPDPGAAAPTFDEEAKKWGDLPVQITEPFSEYDDIPGVDAGSDFNVAAFRLISDDITSMYSDAIIGDSATFILSLNTSTESFIPEFDVVKDKALPLAEAAAREEAFKARIEDIAEQVASAASAETNQTLATTLSDFDVNIVNTDYFTVLSTMVTNDVTYADVLGTKAIDLAPGTIAEPIFVEEGAILARLLSRRPGSSEDAFSFAPQVQRTLIQYRSSQLFESWRDHVLELAEFKDLRQIGPDENPL